MKSAVRADWLIRRPVFKALVQMGTAELCFLKGHRREERLLVLSSPAKRCAGDEARATLQ
jgi:hypothetical protein